MRLSHTFEPVFNENSRILILGSFPSVKSREEGFYYGHPGQYTANSRYIRQWQIVAIVDSCDADGNAVCSLRNKFREGDELEIVGPDLRPFSVLASHICDMDGITLEEPRTPQMLFRMKLPRQVPANSILRRSVDLSAK